MIVPGGRGGRRRRRRGSLAVIHDGLISVSLRKGALAGTDGGSPLLLRGVRLMLLGLRGQADLRGDVPPKHRVDVGEVLEKHRPVHRRNSLEKAVLHGVRGSRGPSAPEGGGRGAQRTAGLLERIVEAQAGQDRRLHRDSVLAAAAAVAAAQRGSRLAAAGRRALRLG